MHSCFYILNCFLYFSFMFASIRAARFLIQNNCSYTVWAAAVPGKSAKLEQGQSLSFYDDTKGNGSIWARTNCNFDANGIGKCESGDCDGLLDCVSTSKPDAPVTLAKYTLGDTTDNFSISLVRGFNVPMEITAMSNGCTSGSKCVADINNLCPTELRDPGGCNDPCTVFNNDQFCCFNSAKCGSTAYSKFFKDLCPSAYTYASDNDISSLCSCPAGTTYKVVLCPSSPLIRAQLATIRVKNNCPYTIWPAILVNQGAQPSTTGFELASGETNSVNVRPPWSGQFWARTQCSSTDTFTCATGECGTGQVECTGANGAPPLTLVEFTIAANNGRDFFDLSLVNGFNLPVSLAPEGGSGDTCIPASCTRNINGVCPAELQVKGSDGSVIGCKSACAAFNQPQYCCTGANSTSKTCQPTSYSRTFKIQCPQAYSYPFDDEISALTCTGGANYAITFCPDS